MINDRSFGENASSVATLVSAFIRGAHENGLLVTAKHFPGVGDSSINPLFEIASINGDRDRLNAVELLPFRNAIESGVDAVMVEQVRVPALDPDPGKLAPVSQKIVSDLLENDLGFKGVVLTDLLEKGVMARLYGHTKGNPAAHAAVDAIKAGCDVIMAPIELEATFRAILKAVQSGEIPESRIDESVRRILSLKAQAGLYREKLVDINQVAKITQNPEDFEFAQHAADSTVTLVRDQARLLPLAKTGSQTNQTSQSQKSGSRARPVVVVLAQDLDVVDNRAFEKAFKARSPDAKFYSFDGRTPGAPDYILGAVARAPIVVVAAYVTHFEAQPAVINGKSITIFGLRGPSGELLNKIVWAAPEKTTVVTFGSPYLIENYPGIRTYICTYAMASTSEISAVKALFGEIQNNARLPVTLPGIAPRAFSVPWPAEAQPADGRETAQ
ncbi:MAG TPA: glycoside hydrolase family 3 N-terminal domain-containing protein [Terriglobia bacterium]|nr:glycoside hydrolase family 3 N-terminal domain-containing protein [Terriglobia bacterium]